MEAMDTRSLIIIGCVVAAVLVLALILLERRRQSVRLKQRFGPEYEQVLLEEGDVRHAETVLADREKRVHHFSIRTLSRADRDRYLTEWNGIQRRFIDDPALVVNEADTLVKMVMSARGYPMANFEQTAADISVNYPQVVQNFRSARMIVMRNGQGQSTTEELRQAMVYYRSLFEELLEAPKSQVAAARARMAS